MEGRFAAAAFRQLSRAWTVFAREGEFVEWRTDPIPEQLDTPWVVFAWGLSCGLAAPAASPETPGMLHLASPAFPFDLSLDGRCLLSFCDRRWPERWDTCPRDAADLAATPDVRLVFDPLYVRTDLGEETLASGVMLLALPASEVPRGRPVTLRITPNVTTHPRMAAPWTPNRRWVRLDEPTGVKGVQIDHGLDLLLGERQAHRAGPDREHRVWFGDMHGHTSFPPCGMCDVEDWYPYARGVANLDFACLTDHDGVGRTVTMTDELWRDRVARSAAWSTPGRFSAIDGYEWTNFRYGHRNVYFDCEDPPLFRCVDENADTPEKLWARLRECKLEGKAVTGGHHVAVLDYPVHWRYHDPVFDRFVEIYSGWGCFEHRGHAYEGLNSDNVPGRFVQDALARGHRLGILASSDNHFGQPGNSSVYVEVPTISGGLMAALAPENTRSAVFDAIHSRRIYGTTGAPILLDFQADGRAMGSEYTLDAASRARGPQFIVRASGVAALDSVELVRDGRAIASWQGGGREGEFEVGDPDWERVASDKGWVYYYARLRQTDGHMAWSSPIWVQR